MFCSERTSYFHAEKLFILQARSWSLLHTNVLVVQRVKYESEECMLLLRVPHWLIRTDGAIADCCHCNMAVKRSELRYNVSSLRQIRPLLGLSHSSSCPLLEAKELEGSVHNLSCFSQCALLDRDLRSCSFYFLYPCRTRGLLPSVPRSPLASPLPSHSTSFLAVLLALGFSLGLHVLCF